MCSIYSVQQYVGSPRGPSLQKGTDFTVYEKKSQFHMAKNWGLSSHYILPREIVKVFEFKIFGEISIIYLILHLNPLSSRTCNRDSSI